MCEERRHMYFNIEKNKPTNQKKKACPMLTPVKNHQGCGHYILKWFVAIYGQAQRSMPGILRKFNQYQLLINKHLCAPSFPGRGATDLQKRKGKAVKWGRSRKAGVGK